MKDILFITFDFKQENYPSMSFSIASLISSITNMNLSISHFSIDIKQKLEEKKTDESLADVILNQLDQNLEYFVQFKYIAIGVTAWSIDYTKELLNRLQNYPAKIILGGYEITSMPDKELLNDFPRADFFIKGFAEKSLAKILLNKQMSGERIFNEPISLSDLKSPYLNQTLPLLSKKIHWETKRGCPYKCGFCEWGNASKSVTQIDLFRLHQEMESIKKSGVTEVNILDPTFNSGKNYISILNSLLEIDKLKITCQARFENLLTRNGLEFLEICTSNCNRVHLEFGLQTIHENEMEMIGRKNNMPKIAEALSLLNSKDISYEVSIIYAIPGQTVESFLETIEFLRSNGCKTIKAYPLRIPKNSSMESRKSELHIIEEKDKFNVTSVISSFSFTKEDRKIMDSIAERLQYREFAFNSKKIRQLSPVRFLKNENSKRFQTIKSPICQISGF